MRLVTLLALLVIMSTSCSSTPSPTHPVTAANLGTTITVRGRAVNRKFGAQVVGEGFELWLEGVHEWPEDYNAAGDRGQWVEVTGALAEDHKLPVFVPSDDQPVVQGIPVPPGTDLEAASHRYVLRDATWRPVND